GLQTALRTLGHIDELYVVDPIAETGPNNEPGVSRLAVQSPAFLPPTAGLTSAIMLAPQVRFSGSLVETVQISDADAFLTAIEKVSGVIPGSKRNNWISPPATESRVARSASDALSPIANLLGSLADIPAVSGHEGEMRRAILAALPSSLRSKVVADSDGNLILALGPHRDRIIFI